MKSLITTVFLGCIIVVSCPALADDSIQSIKEQIRAMKLESEKAAKRLSEMERKLEELEVQDSVGSRNTNVESRELPTVASGVAERESIKSGESPIRSSDISRVSSQVPSGTPLKSDANGAIAQAGKLRLMDMSLASIMAVGSSSANSEKLEALQGGGHDPKERGFNIQGAEFSLSGVVDPYFKGEAHFVFLEEEGVETEELFFKTTSLPNNIELKFGYYLTEFGQINNTHAHAWDWVDSPIIATRLLGEDGLRSAGLRANYLLPTPWYSQITMGIQNAEGGLLKSFITPVDAPDEDEAADEEHAEEAAHDHDEQHEDEHSDRHDSEIHEVAALAKEGGHDHGASSHSIGGYEAQEVSVSGFDDFLYSARWENFHDLSDSVGLKWGASSLLGGNSTGNGGSTEIYGSDVLVKWVPANNFRGYPFVSLQHELILRRYSIDDSQLASGEFDNTLTDWGQYLQALYGFTDGWAIGLRGEYGDGSGTSPLDKQEDWDRAERYRLSPLLSWRLTEYSRLRLQYNYDQVKMETSQDFHSVWLGFDALLGTHPAHRY